jgi:shikimate kinase
VKRHLILVGLPGSGKTTVGRRAAEMLATDFTDLDEVVEAETGRSIAAIFTDTGEAQFRALEHTAMERALAAPPHLIAAGGGWIAQPGNLEAATAAGAGVLYLRVSPAAAAARLGDDTTRPLLAGGNPIARLEALLQEREGWYRKADSAVDAEGAIEAVATKVVETANRDAG